jgi:hypothetical protein
VEGQKQCVLRNHAEELARLDHQAAVIVNFRCTTGQRPQGTRRAALVLRSSHRSAVVASANDWIICSGDTDTEYPSTRTTLVAHRAWSDAPASRAVVFQEPLGAQIAHIGVYEAHLLGSTAPPL